MTFRNIQPAFDLSNLPVLLLWAAARAAGYALRWDTATRRVVMRPLAGGAA